MWWFTNTETSRKRRKNALKLIKISVITDVHLRSNVDKDPLSLCAGDARKYYASHSNYRHFRDIVNSDNDADLVLDLGDALDASGACGSDGAFLSSIISTITPNYRITIGNHDFDDKTYSDLVTLFGRDAEPEIGGSKFNEKIVLENGNANIQLMLLDTNFIDNTHANTARGDYHSDTLSWVTNELATPSSNNILFASHHLPHYYQHPSAWPYFQEAGALAFQAIIDNAVANNPDLKISYIGGHHHTNSLITYDNLGINLPGYRLPTSIQIEHGYKTTITIDRQGNINFATQQLNYPYPD